MPSWLMRLDVFLADEARCLPGWWGSMSSWLMKLDVFLADEARCLPGWWSSMSSWLMRLDAFLADEARCLPGWWGSMSSWLMRLDRHGWSSTPFWSFCCNGAKSESRDLLTRTWTLLVCVCFCCPVSSVPFTHLVCVCFCCPVSSVWFTLLVCVCFCCPVSSVSFTLLVCVCFCCPVSSVSFTLSAEAPLRRHWLPLGWCSVMIVLVQHTQDMTRLLCPHQSTMLNYGMESGWVSVHSREQTVNTTHHSYRHRPHATATDMGHTPQLQTQATRHSYRHRPHATATSHTTAKRQDFCGAVLCVRSKQYLLFVWYALTSC